MAAPEFKIQPYVETGRLDKIISKLGQPCNRSTRLQFLDEGLSYIFSHPGVAAGSSIFLSTKQDANSKELLRWLQEPEKAIEFISTKGRLAKKSDYLELFDYLDSPFSEIAQAMLIGHLSQPTKELERVKKEPEKQQKAALKSNQVGLNFTEAFLEYQNNNMKEMIISILDENFARPDIWTNTLIDILMGNSAFGHPERIAEESDEIVNYLDLQIKKTLGLGIFEKYMEFNKKITRPIELAPGITIELFPISKKPSLEKVWKNKKPFQEHTLAKARKKIIDQSEKQKNLIFTEPIILTSDEPQLTELGVEVIKSLIQDNFVNKLIQITGDFIPKIDCKIIRTSQGRLTYVIGPSKDIQHIRKDLLIKIKEIVFRHSQVPDEENSSLPINQDELNTALEFLKPLEIDPEKVARAIPQLILESQGGLNAISKRGISSKLTLKTESYLREMGLNEIFFQQEEKGIRIITSWNGGKFSFFINREYQPIGLEKLSEENRNWLIMIVFSYLKAIKNRGEEKIVFLNEPDQLDLAEIDDEQPEKKESERQISRIPFLRVLALGDRSHEIAVEKYEDLTQFHFGIGLAQLNALFLQIQDNRNLLTDLNPDSFLNQELAKLPHGQSVRKILEKLIMRTMNKVSRPYWKKTVRNQEEIWKLVPANPPADYDENTHAYMITFVDETELPGAKPREIRCPGVAETILKKSS